MSKILAFAALLLLAPAAFASPAPVAVTAPAPAPAPAAFTARRLSLDVSTTSYHLRTWARDSLNQDNPGLGLEYQISTNWSIAGGFYKNSYSREAAYATAVYTPLHIGPASGWHVAAGADLGVVSGYTSAEVPCRPLMASAIVEIRSRDGWGVNVVAVPNMGQAAGFIGLQIVAPIRL